MLIYLKDVKDLEALRIGLGYYFHNEIAEKIDKNLNKLPPRELLPVLAIAARFIRLMDQIDKELEYYDTSEQKD